MTHELDPQQAAAYATKTRKELIDELLRLRARIARPGVAVAACVGDDEVAKRLRSIVANAPIVVFAVDRGGLITCGQGKGLPSLAGGAADLAGKTFHEAFSGSPAADQYLSRAFRGETIFVPLELGDQVVDLWLAPLSSGSEGVSSVAGIVVDATGRHEAEQELRYEQRLMQQMLCLYEHDRQLIAYEVHDGLVQDATGALMHLETLLQTGELPPESRDGVRHAAELVRKSVHEARELIRGLRPPILDELGVVPAIEYLIDESTPEGPAVELITDVQFDRLEPLLETTIYRIVQEGITNAGRHSHSDRVEVRLTQADERIRVEIQDWGVGFDPGNVIENRFGLQGIRERARLLRGRAIIDSAPGKGTRVLVDLPVAGALHEVVSAHSWSIE